MSCNFNKECIGWLSSAFKILLPIVLILIGICFVLGVVLIVKSYMMVPLKRKYSWYVLDMYDLNKMLQFKKNCFPFNREPCNCHPTSATCWPSSWQQLYSTSRITCVTKDELFKRQKITTSTRGFDGGTWASVTIDVGLIWLSVHWFLLKTCKHAMK